jgi:hypothetical protein
VRHCAIHKFAANACTTAAFRADEPSKVPPALTRHWIVEV